MVHHWEWIYTNDMSHGQNFWSWKEKFEKCGIILQESFGPYLSEDGLKSLPIYA